MSVLYRPDSEVNGRLYNGLTPQQPLRRQVGVAWRPQGSGVRRSVLPDRETRARADWTLARGLSTRTSLASAKVWPSSIAVATPPIVIFRSPSLPITARI